MELVGEDGDFVDEFELHVRREVGAVSGEAVPGGVAGRGEAAFESGGAVGFGAVEAEGGEALGVGAVGHWRWLFQGKEELRDNRYHLEKGAGVIWFCWNMEKKI